MDAAYTYLGLGTIVKEDYQEAGIDLNYDPGANNSYTGFDRFGRVVDQLWASYGATPSPQEEYAYTYDAAGNVTQRTNVNHAALTDQFFYDAVNRLQSWKQNSVTQQTWSLDALGNDLNTGTYNAANEETPDWPGPSSGYDAAGNMTTLSSGDTAIYDAWDRLMEVDNSSGGAGEVSSTTAPAAASRFRRTSAAALPAVTDDYYSGQQVVESDITTNGARNGGYQYVWSPRYIDAPILRDTLNTAGSDIVAADRIFYLGDANYNVTAIVHVRQRHSGRLWSATPTIPMGN